MQARRTRVGVAAITVTGFAWRLVYVLVWGRSDLVFGDGLFYHGQAATLANGQGFIEPTSYFYFLGAHASAKHPPLFSMYLGAVVRSGRALGLGEFDSARVDQVACAVVSSVTIVVVAMVAARLAGDRAAIVGAAIAAALPALWVSDAVVMSETLVALMVALSLLVVVRLAARPTLANAALCGFVIGLATLTRSELLLLLPALVVPALWIACRGAWRQLVLGGAIAVLVFGAVLAPWVIRNERTFTNHVALTTNVGSMLAGANCPLTYFGSGIGGWTIVCNAGQAKGDESVAAAVFRQRGIDYALAHKSRWPLVAAARIGRAFEVFRPFDDRTNSGRSPWVEYANVLTFFPLQIAALLGARRLHRHGAPIWPTLAVLGVVVLTVATSYGTTRFRVPWDVAAAVLASGLLIRHSDSLGSVAAPSA